MPETFLKLSATDRREALAVAAAASGRPLHLLEKDVWLVWLLDVLFRAPFGEHLVFKGGSSLSKSRTRRSTTRGGRWKCSKKSEAC